MSTLVWPWQLCQPRLELTLICSQICYEEAEFYSVFWALDLSLHCTQLRIMAKIAILDSVCFLDSLFSLDWELDLFWTWPSGSIRELFPMLLSWAQSFLLAFLELLFMLLMEAICTLADLFWADCRPCSGLDSWTSFSNHNSFSRWDY